MRRRPILCAEPTDSAARPVICRDSPTTGKTRARGGLIRRARGIIARRAMHSPALGRLAESVAVVAVAAVFVAVAVGALLTLAVVAASKAGEA